MSGMAGLTTQSPRLNLLTAATMAFTPVFQKPADGTKVEFRIDQGLDGMKIDPNTGKLTFTPTDANLGIYLVSIVADVNDVTIPVVEWNLEIEFE